MGGDSSLQLSIVFCEPLHDEVIHEGLGGSFQRLPLLGIRSANASVELLGPRDDSDGQR